MVGIVLTGKENYPEWSQMIKHTLIFNELWKGVCVKDGDNEPVQPTSDKELVIWENKNSKAYALIVVSVNEEVSHHISSYSTAFEALQKLKEHYDSHFALEVVQLMIKLFALELQNNDSLALTSEVKSIMHDIKSTKVELDIPLISFLNALYPTYSNYLESLQANGNLKDITFDSLVKKFAKRAKAFGKKIAPESSEEAVCLAHKEKHPAQYSTRGREFGIKYTQVDDFSLIGYSDSDFNGDKETGLSTSGYAMSLGSGAVSWRSCKQFVPIDSTTEAEYVATTKATKEILWLRKILEDLQVKQVQSTPLMIDNTSAIKLAKNPKFHDRTKNINTKYHLIRHHVEAKTIHLRHCSTNEKIVDIFTKALGREKLERFRMMLGLINIPSD
eukprot:PITA_27870